MLGKGEMLTSFEYILVFTFICAEDVVADSVDVMIQIAKIFGELSLGVLDVVDGVEFRY